MNALSQRHKYFIAYNIFLVIFSFSSFLPPFPPPAPAPSPPRRPPPRSGAARAYWYLRMFGANLITADSLMAFYFVSRYSICARADGKLIDCSLRLLFKKYVAELLFAHSQRGLAEIWPMQFRRRCRPFRSFRLANRGSRSCNCRSSTAKKHPAGNRAVSGIVAERNINNRLSGWSYYRYKTGVIASRISDLTPAE